jgi:hypothetical protein
MGRVGTPSVSFNRFKAMSDALKATGSNILLNLCNWGEDLVHTVSLMHRLQIHTINPSTVGNVNFKLMAHYRRYLRLIHTP